MAIIIKPYSFSAGQKILSAQHNSNFDTIYNEFNGSIDNNNISNTASIAGSKLGTLATITTAAGVIPAANISITTSILASSGTCLVLSGNTATANNAGWAVLRFVGGGTAFVPYWSGF